MWFRYDGRDANNDAEAALSKGRAWTGLGLPQKVKERPASQTAMIPSGHNGCVPAGRLFPNITLLISHSVVSSTSLPLHMSSDNREAQDCWAVQKDARTSLHLPWELFGLVACHCAADRHETSGLADI